MDQVFIKEETLTAIGDAVRAKTGTSELLTPGDMVSALNNLSDSIDISEYEGKYLWCKKASSSGEVLGYVVDGDINRYPDGGMQEGYYYDRI